MMVSPDDLRAACKKAGITLDQLARETGLSKEVLLKFAAGWIAPSAEDRLAILGVLTKYTPPYEPPPKPWDIDEVIRHVNSGEQQYRNQIALDALVRELEEEH